MALPNIFSKPVSDQLIGRIEALNPSSPALWGKMGVSQMLAHSSVMYEMVFENKHAKPNFFMSLILKSFVKNMVVSEKPYKRNSQTAPAFVIKGDRDFEAEKKRLIAYISKSQQLGEKHFDQKESLSFGKLSTIEWNNMFYKHLDHHLQQFGV
ncbi:hypothetical protein GCM10007049_23110 [Echinicola pacifica]|uniref:DUF1569 domain-containing protein n=1 Tax=Echinicola pacifica TaxID=346377 RepID=A0A918URI1_9BACT|nr:DUF1569 domain-containing protein [Echinicola pacifica]GGZ29277.1 hypothetical protein GCM10007049_23110 [Echinicola pacifica]